MKYWSKPSNPSEKNSELNPRGKKKKKNWNLSFCKHFQSLWRFPVVESSALQQLNLYSPQQWVWEVCVCVCCVFCPGCSSGALCEENTRCRVWTLILYVMPWQHPLSGRHMQGRQILSVCVCVSSIVYVKAKPRGPNNKRESKSDQPINTADYLPCMQASTKAWNNAFKFVTRKEFCSPFSYKFTQT